MKKGVNNKHDKFFKAMMEDRSVATDFLKKFLPASVIGLIDFETFENVGTSYITEDLNELFSDAIFKFKLNGIKKNVMSLYCSNIKANVMMLLFFKC